MRVAESAAAYGILETISCLMQWTFLKMKSNLLSVELINHIEPADLHRPLCFSLITTTGLNGSNPFGSLARTNSDRVVCSGNNHTTIISEAFVSCSHRWIINRIFSIKSMYHIWYALYDLFLKYIVTKHRRLQCHSVNFTCTIIAPLLWPDYFYARYYWNIPMI